MNPGKVTCSLCGHELKRGPAGGFEICECLALRGGPPWIPTNRVARAIPEYVAAYAAGLWHGQLDPARHASTDPVSWHRITVLTSGMCGQHPPWDRDALASAAVAWSANKYGIKL